MRLTGIALTALLAATPLIAASAFAQNANTAQQPAAASCPAGTHWTDAGYAPGGKWREAHCAKNDGTD